ncbi:hypothetical protein H7Q97_13075 [Ochrobactrum sp. CM-21-5]|nr:hypothetical protein [Ochrobactrum sp. CM-21-5]MBC2886324.1 hypothetical protein [Ochrobactrum sp. CM-21-5]
MTAVVAVTFIIITFFLIILNINDREDSKFASFFRETLASGQDDKYIINRVSSEFSVCVYGYELERTKKWISIFFDLVRNETWVNPKLYFVSNPDDCADDTFLYVFIHRGEKNSLSTIVGDLSFILKRSGINEFNIKYDNLGFAQILYNKGKEPRAYAAINESINVRKNIEIDISRNVIQQELFQILLLAPDKTVDIRPISIIEERELPGSKRDTDSLSPRQLADRFKLNVPNMCLYDIMLMKVVYAKDPSILNGTLESYLKYIQLHYKDIEQSSRGIQNSPDYEELFKHKC